MLWVSFEQQREDTMTNPTSRALSAQASAFAQLLSASDNVDAAFQQAVTLADGLFPHQVEGVAFLLGRRRAILADDMGLGKTRQAIVSLRHGRPGGPFLVVCPASVKANWAREIRVVSADAAIHTIDGTRPAAIPSSAAWVIVNYDVLRHHVGVVNAVRWQGLIFDEAHYLKNHTSSRSRVAREITAAATGGRTPAEGPAVCLLTGTPLTNRPRDLFVLLQLAGHPLGRSFLSFAKRYCAAERTEYGWKTDGASNLQELTVQLHGVMLRRAKNEVLSLPPKLRTWLPTEVPPGTGAREIADVIKLLLSRQGGAPASDDRRARTHLLSLLTKARQKLAVAKAGTTEEFVTGAVEQGEKVLVFSCFDEPLQRLAKSFGSQAVLLTGETPTAKRQGLVDRFQQDDGTRVFLANIVAGGIGLNLTAATQVVFNDLDWVPANHWQAEDRAYRLGQTRTVNVTYLIGRGTIDDFVQAVLETKATLVRNVVDGEALDAEVTSGVLDELEAALAALSPGLADTNRASLDREAIEEVLRQAAAGWKTAHAVGATGTGVASDPATVQSLRRALEALAEVLAGGRARRYRVKSSSNPKAHYEISVDGEDVTCSCPGFEYRGQCRHARDVKNAIVKGLEPPGEYVAA